LVTSLIRPSHSRFATRSLSRRPNLWKDLVGCWKPSLGVTGITTLRDVSGFERHGTMNGSMTIDDWVIGGNPKLPGYALETDEVDDHILIPDFDYGANGNFSICFWYSVDDVSGLAFQYIFSHGAVNTTNSVNIFFLENNIRIRTILLDSGDTAVNVDILDAFIDGLWHFYVVTVEAGIGQKIYLDGIEIVANANGGNGTFNPTTGIYLGGREDLNVDRFYGGLLNNYTIYNRALLPSEILDMFQHPNAMFQFRDRVIGKAPAVVTVPDDTLAATMQMANSGGMIGAVNV